MALCLPSWSICMETNCALENPVPGEVPPAEAAEQAPEVEVQVAPEEAGMKCYLHNERESVTACTQCGHLICDECDVPVGPHHICKKCLAEAERVTAPIVAAPAEPAPTTRRPSRFAHLALPLIIGAVTGAVGGQVAEHGRRDGMVAALFAGPAAGLGFLLVVLLFASMIIPPHVKREKNGVLGALGIVDFGEALLYTTIFSIIFGIFFG
jgi:hypothetical protein